MTTYPLFATCILWKWQEVVNVILWPNCRATSRGGVEPDMLKPSHRWNRAEVADLLSHDMGNGCPVSSLCFNPAETAGVYCTRFGVGYWWKTKRCKSGTKEKKGTHGTSLCVLSSFSKRGSSGWLLTIQTMKTIKLLKNQSDFISAWTSKGNYTCIHLVSSVPVQFFCHNDFLVSLTSVLLLRYWRTEVHLFRFFKIIIILCIYRVLDV